MATNAPPGGSQHAEDIMARLPSEVTGALSQDQLAALRTAITETQPWRRHPIDIRFTVPLGAVRIYFTLVAGANKRNAERRAKDREAHPLRTASNMMFLGAAVIGLYAIAGVIALIVAAFVRG